jgi:hypothetical protein
LVVLFFPNPASVRQTPEFEKTEFDPALALTWLAATLSHPMGEGEYQRQSAVISGSSFCVLCAFCGKQASARR